MGLYLYIGSYSGEGVKGVVAEGGRKREAETRKLFKSVGGKILQYLFAVGEFDFIIVAEMPDDQAALVPPMLACATGTVHVKTTKLLTAAEMDEVCEAARKRSFRAAGT